MDENIKFFFLRQNQWGNSTYNQYTPDGSGQWKNIESVDDVREAEYLVIMNFPTVHLEKNFPLEKTLYITGEPDEFTFTKRFWDNVPHGSHKFPVTEYGMFSAWHVIDCPFSYDILKSVDIKKWPPKTRDISMVTTKFGDGTEPQGLQVLEGHRLRLKFLKDFITKHPNIMNIYGRDMGAYIQYQDFFFHGGILTDKWNGVDMYRYNIGIENSWQKGLFTSQYCDAVLAGCMPIYWGCPNLEDFFPKNSFVRIDVRKDGVVDEVKDIIKSDIREQNLDELEVARQLILDKYNLFARLYAWLNKIHKL
jgi:hypothetical protein